MSSLIQNFLIAVLSLLIITGCATSYQTKGFGGGYTDTKLSENTYQIRFEGNSSTSQDRTSQFILRRCAEITLENNEIYFVMSSSESESTTSGTSYGSFSYPSGKAIMTIIDDKKNTEKTVLNAITIVEETNEIADGKLSPKAKKNLQKIKNSQ